jgi:hypothetical protein
MVEDGLTIYNLVVLQQRIHKPMRFAMHQSVGNSLRVLQQWNPPAGLNDMHALVDAALANAMYTTHASFHSGLQTTPGALAFHCNMVMNIPLMSDLTLVQQN